jgi:hypothetical protein
VETESQRSRDQRHAINESVHRSANEQREARNTQESTPVPVMRYECECHRTDCGHSFYMVIADYEAVRADGARFVVAPDHMAEEEVLLSTTEAFWVIQKVGEQGKIAADLDPR